MRTFLTATLGLVLWASGAHAAPVFEQADLRTHARSSYFLTTKTTYRSPTTLPFALTDAVSNNNVANFTTYDFSDDGTRLAFDLSFRHRAFEPSQHEWVMSEGWIYFTLPEAAQWSLTGSYIGSGNEVPYQLFRLDLFALDTLYLDRYEGASFAAGGTLAAGRYEAYYLAYVYDSWGSISSMTADGTLSFSVGVPEPGSFVLAGLALAAVGGATRRRRS